ncbi:MAG: DUF368 domain-containing protein [Lachnospiraceae bacterium]|nr:DUF368 domain-containing protein [Lachnospiraceae bacterium]
MIKNVLKGIVIGIANILPGVSGGTMAVSMGIYDRLIHCINHLFKEFKQNVLFLFPIAIGMVIAIIASAFGIDYLFESFPVQTNLLFIGLILGGLPAMYEKVKGNTVRPGHMLCVVLLFLLVVGMALLNEQQGGATEINTGVLDLVKLFLVGVIAAATMVIPGVSGSMMLLLLGYYNPILDAIKDFVAALLHMDFEAMTKVLLILIPFGIGVVVGIVAIARLMEFIFQKYPLYAYWSIIGLLLASPIAIFMVGTFPEITVVRVITGAITFGLGCFISGKLGEK